MKCNVEEIEMIEAYASGALLMDLRTLARLCRQSRNQDEIASLARATILVGGAAMEALLLEAAYIKNPQLYKQDEFRYGGVTEKFKELMGKELSSISPDADELWKWRKALGHSEPESERTRFVGTRINADGAEWASQTLDKLAVIIWGKDMPDWFAKTTGLGRPTSSGCRYPQNASQPTNFDSKREPTET
jgi:hypothetical protein